MDNPIVQRGYLSLILNWHNMLLLASGVIGLLLLTALTTALHNLLLHPLRHHPGSLLAAATPIPYWRAYLRGDIHTWVAAQHRQHGATVRVAPDRLSYIHPAAWKDIYGHRTGDRRGAPPPGKDPRFYGTSRAQEDEEEERRRRGAAAEGGGSGRNLAVIVDDAEHGRVRRIFAHAFSDRGLKAQEPLIRRYVDQLVANLARVAESGSPCDAVKMYNCTTFDVMGDLTFGESLGLLEASELSEWVSTLYKGIKSGVLGQISREYPLLGGLVVRLVPKELKRKAKDHFKFSEERVDRRLEKRGTAGERPDIWGLVLKQEEGRGLGLKDMHANASLFMIAGTETTATLLSGLTYLLLKNPDKYEKLVKEIRGSFESEDELTIENLQRLEYMHACFQEGLRIYPPVPIGLPREIPKGGASIMGEWLPEKTRVSIPQWTANLSSENFQEPLSFIPERWLPGSGFDKDRKDVLQPFSIGPRNCLGQNLAYHEMRIILSKVLWHFDLTMEPESDGWLNQKCYVLWEKGPLMVTVTARK
ncbi:Cytochrome P450 [Neofusicoccum parvum]|nr:Cytochrome P450 [Neofusicoccum parvum]